MDMHMLKDIRFIYIRADNLTAFFNVLLEKNAWKTYEKVCSVFIAESGGCVMCVCVCGSGDASNTTITRFTLNLFNGCIIYNPIRTAKYIYRWKYLGVCAGMHNRSTWNRTVSVTLISFCLRIMPPPPLPPFCSRFMLWTSLCTRIKGFLCYYCELHELRHSMFIFPRILISGIYSFHLK